MNGLESPLATAGAAWVLVTGRLLPSRARSQPVEAPGPSLLPGPVLYLPSPGPRLNIALCLPRPGRVIQLGGKRPHPGAGSCNGSGSRPRAREAARGLAAARLIDGLPAQ